MVLVAIMMCISHTACSSDSKEEPAPPQKKPIEEFNQGNMSFTEGAGEQSFSFVANEAWTISVATTKADEAWCKVSPTSGGAGSHVVKITTTENTSYDDRSVTITLKSGSESKSFVVTQKQKDALLLTSDKVEIEQKGGTFTIEVKANVSYTATIGETCKSWITEGSNTRALSTSTKTYSVAASEESEKREGTITFTAGNLSETVHIYQAGGDIILLTKDEYYVDAAGENITVELKSNCDYEVEMPNVDWIHTTSTRGMSSHTLYYAIDANEGYDSREAKINFRNNANNVVETLTIIQAQRDAIIISKKEFHTSVNGETVEVELSSNTDYTISIDENCKDWISQIESNETKALMDKKLYFKIEPNSTTEERIGKIMISDSKEINDTVSIIQQKVFMEIVSNKEINFDEKGGNFKVKLQTNVDYEMQISETGWISHISSSSNLTEHSIEFNISANDIEESRTGTVIFSDKYKLISDTIKITQEAKPAAIKEVTVNTAGTLKQIVPEIGKITSLKINGELDANDIDYIRRYGINNIKCLDLSNANIVGNGRYYFCDEKGEDCSSYLGDNMIDIYMFADFKNMESIILPNSVTRILSMAFYNCKKLTHIVISPNITKTGAYMFKNCEQLAEINLPDNIQTIREGTFWGCTSLNMINLNSKIVEIEKSAFYGCSSLNKIFISDLSSWLKMKFGNDSSNPLSINENVELYLNDKLVTDIVIPKDINKIEDYTFCEYKYLKSVNVSERNDSLKIGNSAFYKCRNLTEFIGEKISTIGSSAFVECNNLKELTLKDDWLRTIGSRTFAGCKNLKAIPRSKLREIPQGAFYNCSNLTFTSIVGSKIGDAAFGSCTSLTQVEIHASEIGDDAFANCSNLSSVTMRINKDNLGRRAFKGCKIKDCYNQSENPPYLHSSDFFGTVDYMETTLYIPKGYSEAYKKNKWGVYFYNIIEKDE